MSENTASPRNSNLVTVAVLVIALAAVFLVGQSINGDDDTSPAAAGRSSTETYGVVTNGEGTITARPDQLKFTVTVTNRSSSTATALAKTNHDGRVVIIQAKKAGVAAADIETAGFSVRQTYVYGRFNGHYGRHNTGYASTQQIKILVRKLNTAGKILGAVTTAAGNAVSISGIQLTISNRDELIAKARAEAVTKSRAAADALAKAGGRKVDHLEFVQVIVPQRYGCCYNSADSFAAASPGLAPSSLVQSSIPISPGKQDVTVTVQARWALAGQK